MKHDYYAIISFTSLLLHLLPTNCSLSTVTRYKRETVNTVHTPVDETLQITENPQSQTSDHQPFLDKCELLIQYLHAFSNAIKEAPDTRKGGFDKTFEMNFPKDSHNEEDYLFYLMLQRDYLRNKSIINGKMKAVTAVQKISLGRKLLSMNLGLKKNYILNDQATSIVNTALHVNWASIVGGYLDNKQNQCLFQLEQVRADLKNSLKYDRHRNSKQGEGNAAADENSLAVPQNHMTSPSNSQPAAAGFSSDKQNVLKHMATQDELNKARIDAFTTHILQLDAAGFSAYDQKQYLDQLDKMRTDAIALETIRCITEVKSRLRAEGIKIEYHMKSIHKLLFEVRAFFDKLAASLEKKGKKPWHKSAIGKSNGAQDLEIAKEGNIFNPAAKIGSELNLLASLEQVFGPEQD